MAKVALEQLLAAVGKAENYVVDSAGCHASGDTGACLTYHLLRSRYEV